MMQKESPRVSIVICSRNPVDPPGLHDQTFKDFEVIYATGPGIVNAMNIALAKAKGEILVRIDDDVDLSLTWLEELIKPFSDPSVAGVTGPTFVPSKRWGNRDSIKMVLDPNWFIRWVMDNKQHKCAKILRCGSVSYGSNFRGAFKDNPDHLEGTNWAMRTDLIRLVGGFDPAFDGVCEWFDTDVEQKILRLGPELGYRLVYNPKAYLWHMLEKGEHYDERYSYGRIKNWLRFHFRHSKFHYKKVIWLFLMVGYITWQKLARLFRQ